MNKVSIIDFLGFIIVKAISILLLFVPLGASLWIGRRIGDFMYFINSKRRSIAYANLKSAFPLKENRELKRINRAHFENMGMNIIEVLKVSILGKSYLNKFVDFKNLDRIGDALKKNKGVILVTAHFGSWELSSLAVSLKGYPMSVFAREQKYTRLNNLLNQSRALTGCKVIAKGFSVRDIIKTLQANGIIGMLSDQDAGANGVFINFLGRPASMAKGPVVFSLRTGAIILPSFIRRLPDGRHIVEVGEVLELINTGDEKKDIEGNLKKISDISASYINNFPEQWLWAHKRWKSTPQRTVLVLSDGKAGHFNQGMAVGEMIKEVQGSTPNRKDSGHGFKVQGIGENPIVKIKIAEVRFKNRFTKMFLNVASIFAGKRCQGCLRCVRFCLTKDSFEKISKGYADIVVSCGTGTVATNIFLKYENNAKNIVVMKPGLGRGAKFDLVILPRHDMLRRTTDDGRRTTDEGRRTRDDGRGTPVRRSLGEGGKDEGRLSAEALAKAEGTTDDGRGTRDEGRRTRDDGRRTRDDGRRTSNVLITEAAPNRITERAMQEAVSSIQHRASRIEHQRGLGLLIGGDAKNFKLKKEIVEQVLNGILKISDESGLDLYISTSRRTSKEIDEFLKKRLSDNNHCKLLVIANEKNVEGIVPAIFGLSDIIITSPDSVSMVSEAASSGKYVVVFRPNLRTTDEGPRTRDHGRGTRDHGPRTRDDGRGTMDDGRGTMDEGRGTMDEGRGTTDEGRGTVDEGRGTMDEGRLSAEALAKAEGTTKYERMISSLESEGYIKTAGPNEIYSVIKEILNTRPKVKRLSDRERIVERLKGIV